MSELASKYQSLKPELKQRLLDKIRQLPEEVQFKAQAKLGIPMADFASEGVEEANTLLGKSAMDRAAVDVTEGLAPRIGAGPAKALGMGAELAIPAVDTALTVGGLAAIGKQSPNIARGMVKGGEALVRGIAKVGNTIFGQGEGAARLAGKQALAPLQDRLIAQQMSEKGLIPRQAARKLDLLQAKKSYGKAIGQAEELGGYASKETPESFGQIIKDPQELKRMGNTLRSISEKPSSSFTAQDLPQLQMVRKFAQHFREVGPAVENVLKANIEMGGSKSFKEMKRLDPVFGSVTDAWEKVGTQLTRLPTETKLQKAAIQRAMLQTKLAIKKTQRLTDIAVEAGAKRNTIRKYLIQAGIPSAILGGLLYKVTGGK